MTKKDIKKTGTSTIKDVTPDKKKNTKKKSEKESYGYSINLSGKEKAESPNASPASGSAATPQDKLKESLSELKNNPQALDAIKQALANRQNTQPFTKTQKAANTAKKFTIANIQKALKNSLKNVDLLTNYIIKKEGHGRNSVLQQARSPILFGMWVAFFTFIVAGIWSGFAPLDSSSHATGFVIPTSKKQLIQHKEGGIIEKIFVKEGDIVSGGDKLVKLSDTAIKAQIIALKAQKKSTEKQLKLVSEQLEEMTQLFAEGFVQKDKLIHLQSREAELIGHLSEIDSRIISMEESHERLMITSPISGSVNQIQFHTIGAVIPPGGTLMTVVPKDENLIIEAYVRPDDIDQVYVGLKAKIRVSAFRHRSVAPMEGTVTHISSDVVEPPQHHHSQESMVLQHGLQYRVKIEVDKDQLTKISKYRNYELHPGMMADVMIVTGERTVLQYLMDPITSTFWHAFVEK